MSVDIEFVGNQRVLKVEGKQVCSVIDPTKEAQSWLAKNHNLLLQCTHSIYLGLGSGHIFESMLPEFRNRIQYIIETRTAVVNQVKSFLPADLMNRVHVVQDLDHLSYLLHLETVLARPFRIIKTPISNIIDNELYAEIQSCFVGRTEEGLQFILKNSPDLKSIVGPRSATRELLSIKHLNDSLIYPKSGRTELVSYVRALRELVK